MLSFTHQSRATGNKWISNEPDFQPIIITNKLPKEVSPKKQQKIIAKVTQNKKSQRQTSKDFSKGTTLKPKQTKTEWNTGSIPKGAFDKNLKKNELAAEQRRLRAELKKQKELNHQQIIINEKKIGTKAIKMMKEKDDEIQYLRQMIQKQKEEKAKIDRLYEQKKQEIQRQRQELIELERKIQKEGVKEKRVIEQIKKIASPERDYQTRQKSKGRMAKQLIAKDYYPQQSRKHYDQPTQSQTLYQKNMLRQQQLDYLINQRQKAVKGLPNINYSPTLIPLLSKASYKIISTHVSQIVELLVDELMQEQVYLLQQIELQEAKVREEQKSKHILNEYYDMVTEFVDQNDQIANKIGKYSSMNFTDIYKPKNYPGKERRTRFEYDEPSSKVKRRVCLGEEFDDDRMEEIQNRKDRFIRFVSNFDEYKKTNLDMFAKCAEEIIDETIQKLARQLDKGSGEFVDIVFRNEFN